MKNLKKNLLAVNKELKALAKKTESLLKAVDKFEKPKAKPTKVKAVKKAAVKKPAPKKAAPATAADTILAIINRSKKGVDVSTLIAKTGFNKRKIYNNVKVLKKRDKIKSVGKGVYLKA
jgi:hypothetical protein